MCILSVKSSSAQLGSKIKVHVMTAEWETLTFAEGTLPDLAFRWLKRSTKVFFVVFFFFFFYWIELVTLVCDHEDQKSSGKKNATQRKSDCKLDILTYDWDCKFWPLMHTRFSKSWVRMHWLTSKEPFSTPSTLTSAFTSILKNSKHIVWVFFLSFSQDSSVAYFFMQPSQQTLTSKCLKLKFLFPFTSFLFL